MKGHGDTVFSVAVTDHYMSSCDLWGAITFWRLRTSAGRMLLQPTYCTERYIGGKKSYSCSIDMVPSSSSSFVALRGDDGLCRFYLFDPDVENDIKSEPVCLPVLVKEASNKTAQQRQRTVSDKTGDESRSRESSFEEPSSPPFPSSIPLDLEEYCAEVDRSDNPRVE